MMQRLTGLLLIFLLTGNISAQKIDQKNVPAVIVNSFQVKFPTADDVDWRLKKGIYRVKFEVNDKDHEVRLDNRGKIVKHEQDLFFSEIPEDVLQTIREKAPFFDLEDADKITENGKTIFEINFEIDNKDHDFWINERGKLLNYRQELKKSEVPDFIWSYIRNTSGNLDVEHREYTLENGKGVYWVDGDINNMEHDFYFTEKGKIIKYIKELRKNEIPAGILSTLNTKYKDYEICDAVLREDNAAAFYDIQLRKSRKIVTLTFNRKGELIDSVKNP